MIQFKYNGKIYDTSDLTKKLKKMKISESDIEIITRKEEIFEQRDIQLYYFKNEKTGSIITSIYPTLDDLKLERDINDYVLC